MSRFSTILRPLVYSNIFVSFCAMALGYESLFLTRQMPPLTHPLLWFIFTSTLFIYNFQRLVRFNALPENPTNKLRWMFRNKKSLQQLTFFALLASLFLAWQIDFDALLTLVPVGIIAIAYPLKFSKNGKRLREIPFIKVILIALVWAVVTVILPLAEIRGVGSIFSSSTAFIFFGRFFFILAITLPFDIRDLPFDRKDGLKTIPVVFGIKKTRIAALGCLVAFFAIHIIQAVLQPDFFSGGELAGLGISSFITAMLIIFSGKDRKEMYYSLLVESTMILQCLSLYLADFIVRS